MQSSKQPIQQYLEQKVNPIFQELLVELIKSKPRNILHFSKAWFQKKCDLHDITQKIILSDTDSDSQEQFINQEIIQQKKMKSRWYKQRKGICGQVYGIHNKIQNKQIEVILKKASINNRILFRLKSLFLFKDFDDEDTDKLISAMAEQTYEENTVIIKQGDEGSQIYIVDSGQFHCYRKSDDKDIYIKTIVQGQMFGQISMLYNTKRTASIKVKIKATCFKLNRETFNTVVRQKNIRKRKAVSQIIKRIQLFRELDTEELFLMQDIVQEMPVHLNQYIVRQGKVNTKLFMVEKGKLVSLKKQKNGHQMVKQNYNDGDYFGLQSLLSKQPSQTSVMALTTSKLYFLDLYSIQRVIGSIHKVLLRDQQLYQKYKNRR